MSHYVEMLVSLGFLGGLMWGMMKFMLRDIHKDLDNIRTDINGLRFEISEIKTDMKRQDVRIDHLYQILIELVKDRK